MRKRLGGNAMMKKMVVFSALAFLMTSCFSMPKLVSFESSKGDKRLPKDEQKREFQLLSGEDYQSHWVTMGKPDGWSYQEGVIRSEGGKDGQWMRSVKAYSDFVLRLEYRVSPGGNSGVFIRCKEDGNPWETGHECQISNEQPPRDALHCTGTLYGNVAADPRPDESPDVWHTYEIFCHKKRIQIQVDGRITVDANMDQIDAIRNKPMQGFIGLQDSHTGEGFWIEYRNVRIRDISGVSQAK